MAAGICAQGRKQDANVRCGEQGGFPGTPGGLQVNRIDPYDEGRLRTSPATKAANNREIAPAKSDLSSLDQPTESLEQLGADTRRRRKFSLKV